eukprot:gnl/Trimastix_PCT/1343.p1 GENE.gnl/Trimastix_PCT/1343~~gnl/Trimastix_PCT/1343.p1  ORF type:complete len:282 (-),score=9.35 gnl/Trimastix_PCT/1343:42-887(-)
MDGFFGDFFSGFPSQRPRRSNPFTDPFSDFGFPSFPSMGAGAFPPMGMGGASFQMESSSSSMGPGGVSYSQTTTQRMGPGGVVETQRSERDSRSGIERISVRRELGERSVQVSRERDAEGREQHTQHIENLRDSDLSAFDEEWRSAADRSLPSWGHRGPFRLASGGLDPPLAALPAGPHSASGRPHAPVVHEEHDPYLGSFGTHTSPDPIIEEPGPDPPRDTQTYHPAAHTGGHYPASAAPIVEEPDEPSLPHARPRVHRHASHSHASHGHSHSHANGYRY